MVTVSKALLISEEDNICQGDVFQNVKYAYIDSEDNEGVEVVEFIFPMAIIVSQACDVISMSEMVTNRNGKATKFMPSILMCPIYDVEFAKKSSHLDTAFSELRISRLDGNSDTLFNSADLKIAQKNWHYRFHPLTVEVKNKSVLTNALIDFKHYFTVSASYLVNNRYNRLFHLDDIYAEQITLKFSTYLSRVAIPD